MPTSLTSRGPVAYEATAKAEESRAWDGAAAEKRVRKWASSDGTGEKDTMDWPKYRRAFAWFDAAAKEDFGSYKLIHHDVVDDALSVVWKGCAAAAAVCMGARGGADIPEGDMPRVKSHLGRHYAQFDKTAPWDQPADRSAAAPPEAAGDPLPGEGEVRMPMQWRSLDLAELRQVAPADGADEEWVYFEFPVTSEQPVKRWFGVEILGHDPGECRLERLKDGAAWRDDHWGPQVGVSEDGWIEKRRTWTRGRFSRNQGGQDLQRDVADGIRRNVSAGYIPHEMVLVKEDKNGQRTYRVTDWEIFHIAFTPDPADATVGIGRSQDGEETYPVRISGGEPAKEGREMPDKPVTTSGGGAAPAAAAPEGGGAAARTLEPPKKTRAEEIVEIRAACKENGVPDAVLVDILGRELTPPQAAEVIFGWRSAQSKVAAQPAAERLLSPKDAARYSLRRAMAMAANLIRRDGIEAEVSKYFERHRPAEQPYNGGIFVPYRVQDLVESRDQAEERQIRALEAGTKGQGAELVGRGVEFIDLLRNATVLGPLGGTFLSGLSAPIPFAKKTGAVAFSWLGEGKAITPSDIKFVPLELGPKRIGGAQDVGRELLVQSSLDVENLVTTDINDGAAITLDYGGLFGTGGAEPLGLWNLPTSSGIQSVAMGGVPTWVKLTSIPGKTARKNGLAGRLGWATTPELATVLQATPKISGAAQGFLWDGPIDNGLVAGYKAAQSPQMRSDLGGASDEHALLFGPWQHVIVGLWGGAEITVDPYTQALNNMVRIVLNMLGNVLCRYPEAFVKGTGAKLA